jgi:hypothetical protein
MFDPDEVVNGISAYLNLLLKNNNSPLHIFYISNKDVGLFEEDLRKSFMFFMKKKFPNTVFTQISKIKEDFLSLSEDEKVKYFSSDMNVIDCSEIDKETVSTYNSLNSLNDNIKSIFMYYVPSEKKQEFISSSQQYKSAGVYYDLDKEIYAFYQYTELKDEVDINRNLKITNKKPKI